MQLVIGDQPLHIAIKGAAPEAASRAVIFLHGWGRSGDDFDDLVARLTPRLPDSTLIQVDLPGFGRSPLVKADGLSLEDYCTTLRLLMEKVGLGRVVLVGHSLGGRIAIRFAARFPERAEKLILISAAGIRRRSLNRTLLAMGRALFKSVFFALGDLLLVLRLKNLLGATFGSRDYQTAHGALRATLKKILAEDLRADAKRISAPTLLLWGKNDEITPLRDAAKYHSLIKESTLTTFDAGHFVFLEKQEESAAAIVSFLQH